ncbi:MAG: ribonuclease HI, partial [Acidobacteria bacterium]|nr:ribonuclease HI [Acidobacteriota bacterium]
MSAGARHVYTDGACRGNPGPGGWAWAEPGGEWASGADAATTNQRMEITAALRAAERFDDDLVIVSDSTYVVHCWRDRWWEGWIRRGWRNASKQPVANRDLWEQLVPHFRDRPGLRLEWVKGHSGDEMNDV